MNCSEAQELLSAHFDGELVAIFEHDIAHSASLGDRPATVMDCNGQRCELVQVDGRLAVTCQLGGRRMTLVGAQDEAEARSLVAWLQESDRARVRRS